MMNVFLWITALGCWSIAAFLIVGVVGPSLLEPWRMIRDLDGDLNPE